MISESFGTDATSSTTVISGVSCDTNILLYSIDRRDPIKHPIAKRVVDACSDAGCALSLQCLNEFFRAAIKKNYVDIDEARSLIEIMRRSMLVFPVNERDLLTAIEIFRTHKLQFFDTLLIATVERAGCTTLISEDMQHGARYGGVTVINPFKLTSTELDQLLA